jgi:hypothetical protein
VQNAPPPHIQTPTAPGFNPGQINRYNPPHRAAGGPANAGQTYVVNERGIEYLHMGSQSGYISPSGGVPPHSHDIYISGKKVMEATSAHLGQRLAMSSTAPYTRG